MVSNPREGLTGGRLQVTVSVPPSEVQGPLVVLAAALWQSWGTGSASGLQLGSGSGPFPEPEPVGCVSVFLGLGCLPRERLENFLGPGRDLILGLCHVRPVREAVFAGHCGCVLKIPGRGLIFGARREGQQFPETCP